jgi:hypothetical protein
VAISVTNYYIQVKGSLFNIKFNGDDEDNGVNTDYEAMMETLVLPTQPPS